MNLIDTYKQLLGGAKSGLSTVQHTVQQAVPSVGAHLASSLMNSQPGFGAIEGIVSQHPQSIAGQYTRNRVVEPISQGFHTAIAPQSSIPQRIGGVVQGGFGALNATPGFALFNTASGSAAGLIRSIRTGQNPYLSVLKGITQPTSLSEQGLGIQGHPFIAMGIDTLALRNPKQILEDPLMAKGAVNLAKGGVNLIKNLRELRPIHPQDIDFMHEFNDLAAQAPKGGQLRDPKLIQQARDVATHYYGKKWQKAGAQELTNLFNQSIDRAAAGKDFNLKKITLGDRSPLTQGSRQAASQSLTDSPLGLRNQVAEAGMPSATNTMTLYRGEPTGYGKPFGSLIKTNKYGIPVTRGGNHGIPTSTDLEYVTHRFAGEKGTVMQYTPKRPVKVLSDPQEIMQLAGVKDVHSFFHKSTGNRIPPMEAGTWYRKAREAGYDAVDLSKIENIMLNTKPPEGVIRLLKTPENEVRILNPDAFDVKPHVAQERINDMPGGGSGGGPKMGFVASRPVGNPEPLPFGESTKPEIPTDLGSQNVAALRTVSGKGGGLDKETDLAFRDWVNTRRATKVEGLLKQKSFADLESKGMDGIFEFQGGNKSGRYADVKRYFDSKRDEVIAATGKKFGYKQDYLPQLWSDPEEKVQQVFGNTLSQSAPFTMESVIKDYKQGLAAGLTPRFQNISQLAGWYEARANKLIADHNFFSYLAKDGFIQPQGRAPREWVTLEPDRFPKVKVSFEGKEYSGTYKAPPELADKINNYLYNPAEGSSFSRGLNSVANAISAAKNRLLSFGVPATGINAHGFNILRSHVIGGTGGNPITRLATGLHYMVRPGAAQAALDKELATAPQAVKAGLTLSTEIPNKLMDAAGFRSKFGEKWNQAFEQPLFDKMIPALKLSSYNELVKNGMNEREAATLANNVYGGINWEQLGRSRDFQNLMRSIILAPDWAESRLKVGGNIAKSFVSGGKVSARYRTMAATIVGLYVTENVANYLTSGHFLFQNDPGHTFENEAGYTGTGQKRYLRSSGTAEDFVRLPYDIAIGLAKGDPSTAFRAIGNRLSAPAGAAVHLITNTNYKGQPIYGKDKFGNPMTPFQSASGVVGEIASGAGFPSFLQNTLDYASGKQGGEATLTQSLELPFRYTGGATSAVDKQVGGVATDAGVKGKGLYDFYKSLDGQRKFSDNQMSYIQQQGMQGVKDLLQLRQQKQQINEAKKGEQANSGTDQAYAAETNPNAPGGKIDLELAKTYVQLHGGTKRVGNTFVYNDNGSAKTIDLSPVQPPQLTGAPELDSELLSQYASQLSSHKTAILKLYALKQIDQETTVKALQAVKTAQDAIKQAKPKSGGGKAKARKVKRVKIAIPKAPKAVKRYTLKKITKQYRLKPVKLAGGKSKTPTLTRS